MVAKLLGSGRACVSCGSSSLLRQVLLLLIISQSLLLKRWPRRVPDRVPLFLDNWQYAELITRILHFPNLILLMPIAMCLKSF